MLGQPPDTDPLPTPALPGFGPCCCTVHTQPHLLHGQWSPGALLSCPCSPAWLSLTTPSHLLLPLPTASSHGPHSTFTPPNVRHWLLRTVGICPVKASAEGNPQGRVGGIRSGQCPRPTSGREHSLWQGMASKDSLLFEQILELKGTSGLGRSSPTRSPLFSGASLPALLAAQCPRGLCPLTSSALCCQGWSEDGGDLSSALVAGMTDPRLLGAQGHHSRRYTHGPPVGRGGGTKGQVWSGQS